MQSDVIALDSAHPEATLTIYIQTPLVDSPTRVRPALLIVPGGGYAKVSDREGEPVALSMLARGFNAFVLRYAVAPAIYPTALHELATAVRLIRRRAAEWQIDSDRIILLGFSAGGHLAAQLATEWQRGLAPWAGGDVASIRPNGLALAYPVITSGRFAHLESFENLLGGTDTPARRAEMSLEKRVTTGVPPTFIWTTDADATVPSENSLLFALALRQAQVPVELHLFQHGAHGLSLGTRESYNATRDFGIEPSVAEWPDLFETWFHGRFG